jgi:hypothetical protein
MSKELSWDEVGVVKIPLRGKRGQGKFALVDGDYDGEYLSNFRWTLNPGGYVMRKKTVGLDGTNGGAIYLHREVCRPLEGHWVDHINRNTLDNRSVNLRSVTPSVNALNRGQGKRTRKGGGYRGVKQCSGNRWQTMFRHEHVGTFHNEIEAAKAYDKVAHERYGVDAVLNFPMNH